MEELKKTLTFSTIVVLCTSVSLFAVCPPENALQFDGINAYVEIPDDDSLTPSDEITIAFWLYNRGGMNAGIYKYASCPSEPASPGNSRAYIVDISADTLLVKLSVFSSTNTYDDIFSNNVVEPNAWHHIAATFDQGDAKIYIDGVLDSSETMSVSSIMNDAQPLIFGGHWSYCGADNFVQSLNGILDDVRIYDRALAAEEVKEIYCYGVFADPNLVGYWDFDEGTGQVAQDSSGNNNHGQLGSTSGADASDPNWVVSDVPFPLIYYVDDNAPNDPFHWNPDFSDPNENGSCEHPFDSIQEAIDYAADYNCDCNCSPVIVVFDGYYTGTGNYDIDTNGLAVRIESQNGPDECLIDCNSDGRAFILQSGEDVNTIIDGFTIINGYSSQHGGAIYCANSSPTIQNCLMAFNYADWSGGAILCEDSNAQITDCTIIGNYCDASGAGVCCLGSSATIKNCLIAFNDGYFSGGAGSIYDSNMNVINCTIADNLARHSIGAGGIHCAEANAVITNAILWYNYSYDDNQIGLYYGDVTVTYSDIQMPDINDPCWPGLGNIKAQPLFADYYFIDYHLKSAAGRWTPIFHTNGDFNNDGFIDLLDFAIFALYWQHTGPGQLADLEPDDVVDFKDLAIFVSNWLGVGENIPDWILDDETSPCIDAGDPNSDYSLEPAPNGNRINMGAYGNTEQASKSPQ